MIPRILSCEPPLHGIVRLLICYKCGQLSRTREAADWHRSCRSRKIGPPRPTTDRTKNNFRFLFPHPPLSRKGEEFVEKLFFVRS
jgi:hypothetical protein